MKRDNTFNSWKKQSNIEKKNTTIIYSVSLRKKKKRLILICWLWSINSTTATSFMLKKIVWFKTKVSHASLNFYLYHDQDSLKKNYMDFNFVTTTKLYLKNKNNFKG